MKRDFILALSMFVGCAVIGSILGVWMVARFQGQQQAAPGAAGSSGSSGASDWMR